MFRIGPFYIQFKITKVPQPPRQHRDAIDSMLASDEGIKAMQHYRAHVCNQFQIARLYIHQRKRDLGLYAPQAQEG